MEFFQSVLNGIDVDPWAAFVLGLAFGGVVAICLFFYFVARQDVADNLPDDENGGQTNDR